MLLFSTILAVLHLNSFAILRRNQVLDIHLSPGPLFNLRNENSQGGKITNDTRRLRKGAASQLIIITGLLSSSLWRPVESFSFKLERPTGLGPISQCKDADNASEDLDQAADRLGWPSPSLKQAAQFEFE